MIKPPAFWDASALVPLCVVQGTTQSLRLHHRRFLPVVWWAAMVEIHNAISRLHRTGLISPEERTGALQRLDLLIAEWKEITPGDSVRTLAAELLDAYPLRAADSLQLAAALIWCRRRPRERPFVCAGQRLGTAAATAGFSVIALY